MGSHKLSPLTNIPSSMVGNLYYCTYQVALSANAGHLKLPTLPLSPSAVMGTFLHKMYQEVYTGKVKSIDEFNKRWNELERKLEDEHYEGDTGVLTRTNGYLYKRIACKQIILQNRTKKDPVYLKPKASFEDKLDYYQGPISGRADVIIEQGDDVKIIEYKTGEVLEEHGGSIKEAYRKQLLLYAHLYFLLKGRYPNSLIIKDAYNNSYNINFKAEECSSLYEEVSSKLAEINRLIIAKPGEEQFVVNASPGKCGSCIYRISCSFYHELNPKSFNDLLGKPVAIKLINKKPALLVAVEGVNKIIKRLPDFPKDLLGKKVLFFNIKPDSSSGQYTADYDTRFIPV
jgi:RecB family exonuclease